MYKKLLKKSGPFLVICLVFYLFLSWILFFQDTRALLAISNFYPYLRTTLFAIQTTLYHYKLNTVPTMLFAIFAISAFVFYFESLKQQITLRKTVIYSLIFGFIIFFSYPTLSTDIFSYIFSDRIATIYHQNVWQVVPLTHDNDPFAIMADWKNTTRVYGEVNQFIYTIPSILGGNNIISLVVLYKFVSSIFALGIFYILYLFLKTTEKNQTKLAMKLRIILWNPLFLLEFFGSGHNDSIMLFFTLVAYYFFNKKNFLLAGIFLALAVQVKLIPVLLFIFIIITLLQKKSYKGAALFAVSFGLINTISFLLMGVSPFMFAQRVSYNAGVYWQSLPNLLRHVSPHSNYIFSAGFFIIFCLLIFYQIRAKQNPLLVYAYSLAFYLFFFITAYWNWYALWIFTLVPLLDNVRLKFFIVVFSFTSLLAYPFYWLSLRYHYQNIFWPITIYIFVFLIPLIIYLFSNKKAFSNLLALFE